MLAVLSYMFGIYAYFRVLEHKNVSNAYALMKVLSIMMVATVGVLLFKESWTLLNSIGVLLGIGAIVVLA